MAVLDLQAFMQERGRAFDENLDVSPGSPFDTQIIQPLLRRLGTDPFSVDMSVFLRDRLVQAFPDLATDEGDAITDLLIKPATLLWDPIVREQTRLRNVQSMRDPTTLNVDEAEALGANLFSERERGERARTIVRLMFAQPRTLSVSPANYCTTRSGLHFVPDSVQAITVEEMLLNLTGGLYYFDVNTTAENPGVAYNIAAGEVVNIANIDGAVKVTNPRRARGGTNEESASDFVGRVQQELTERSMVTLRGIGAKVVKGFPEATRIGVVGYNDPEMQRDVISGGGLGPILAFGKNASGVNDGTGDQKTGLIEIDEDDLGGSSLEAIIGQATDATMTLVVDDGDEVIDVGVKRVIQGNLVELETAVVSPYVTGMPWSVRRRSLTLSGIPGGILFPDSSSGSVTIPSDQIHIGGAYDIYVRPASLDEGSLFIDSLSDMEPELFGTQLSFVSTSVVSVNDLTLGPASGSNYAPGDDTYNLLQSAKELGLTLRVMNGASAGNYRILGVSQTTGASPEITIQTASGSPVGEFRWRITDAINVDLAEPRDVRIVGTDMQSVQNNDILRTASNVDLVALGVSVNDVVRIENGLDKGDYKVLSLPAFDRVKVDRILTRSAFGLSYSIFRPNDSGGVARPIVRVKEVRLLDTSGQPVGSTIPYSRPVDIRSNAFQNPGRGVKADVADAVLGIVSIEGPFDLDGLGISISLPVLGETISVGFVGNVLSAADVADAINAAADAILGPSSNLAVDIGSNRVGIRPSGSIAVISEGSARSPLFGAETTYTTADIRSPIISSQGGWSALSKSILEDGLDVAQVLDGTQLGFYSNLHIVLGVNGALVSGDPSRVDYGEFASFYPEFGRRVQIGSRSLGSVRTYYLNPTSIEFNQDSFFSATLANGASVRFFPDPTVGRIKLPPPPTTTLPKDGEAESESTVFSVSEDQDLILSGIQPGDELEILYVPIIGSAPLADPVEDLAFTSLVIALGDGADQTVTFVPDGSNDTDVSRTGVIEQINDAVGVEIARLGSSDELELEADVLITIRDSSANSLLSIAAGTSKSAQSGTYIIQSVDSEELILDTQLPAASPSPLPRQAYRISRRGQQRISSTEMSANVTTGSLYYFDVELVSEGTGALWNIQSNLQMSVDRFRSDGYHLTSEDPNLTFSAAERPVMHISKSMLEVGVSDDPSNATQLSGQPVEVVYERAPIVSDVQNFALAETERVVNASPLSRHLIPHFVRFDFTYTGGARTDVMLSDIENYINGLFPQDFLRSSDLQEMAYRRGASSVSNPLELIAVVHNVDRSVVIQRSQDALNTGRLAAFIPDILRINRGVV